MKQVGDAGIACMMISQDQDRHKREGDPYIDELRTVQQQLSIAAKW